MTSLPDRQAKFVYECARQHAEADSAYPAQFVPLPWDKKPPEFRPGYVAAVQDQIRNPRPPRELHIAWMSLAEADGWTYGPVYSEQAKTHPELVPYERASRWKMQKEKVWIELCALAGRFVT